MESTTKKILLSLILYACINVGCFAQNQYKIYEGLIFHFAKYTQWPASNAEIILGTMGKTALNQELRVLNGKIAGTSKISIREVKEISDLTACNIVFVPGSMSGRFNDITAQAKQHNTLVISDSPGACYKRRYCD
jgi:hypothetical protein